MSQMPIKWCRKIAAYYLSHTNDITVKQKLLVSASFASLRMFPQTAELAESYVGTYSNNWQAWRLLGTANLTMRKLEKSLLAWTNAIRLGDEVSYVLLGEAALEVHRLDIVQSIVPDLLRLKQSRTIREIDPLTVVDVLVRYSLKTNRADIFVKALEGIEPTNILADHYLARAIAKGCEMFKPKELEGLCEAIAQASAHRQGTNSSGDAKLPEH
jgi:hypothetical protein